MDNLNIQHDTVNHKFFVFTAGKESLMEYRVINENTLDYFHTFTPPELRGQGIAEKIVRVALDYAKQNNFKIIPSCPYVAKFVASHSEYQSLITK